MARERKELLTRRKRVLGEHISQKNTSMRKNMYKIRRKIHFATFFILKVLTFNAIRDILVSNNSSITILGEQNNK